MAHSVQASSGNIFRDLGCSSQEALHLTVRADLMIEITKLIEERGLTQAAAAELLKVTPSKINDLVHGKIDRFSIDSLIEILGRAGVRVSFHISPDRQVA